MIKRVLKAVCLAVSVALAIFVCDRILVPKDTGVANIKNFYKQEKNTVDVVNFGSSHMFVDVNPAQMYRDHGIAAYNLCSSSQPVWDTYHYMKECLKYQSPKVMVVELYMAAHLQEEYASDTNNILNMAGMRLSRNKLEAVRASVPEEDRLALLLGYPYYHVRYSEVTREDYALSFGDPRSGWYKGYEFRDGVEQMDTPQIRDVTEREPCFEKNLLYIEKMIGLARQRQISLIFTVSPYQVSAEHQAVYNSLKEKAQREGVPFIDMNLLYDELGMDFQQDFEDPGHANYLGSEKITGYLSAYLKENFDLPDRRKDGAYASWEECAAQWERLVQGADIRRTEELSAYMDRLADLRGEKGYEVVISLSGGYREDGELRKKCLNLGIDGDSFIAGGTWVMRDGEFLFYSGGQPEFEWGEALGGVDLAVRERSIVLGKEELKKVGNGVNIVIYDREKGETVDAVGFDVEDDYRCVR